MALIFKKGKEEEEEQWAGEPHLGLGTTTEHVPGTCSQTCKGQEMNQDQSTCFPRQMLLGQPDGFLRQEGWRWAVQR